MEIKTSNQIHVEIAVDAPDYSINTEKEYLISMQDYNKRCRKKWVAVDDILNWIKKYETSLGDLPKELSELKHKISPPIKENENMAQDRHRRWIKLKEFLEEKTNQEEK